VTPGLILPVDWYTSVGTGGSSETIQIVNRPGFSKVRITCIGPGGAGQAYYYYEQSNDTEYYDVYGGAGGNIATSLLTIGSSASLSVLFNNANTYFQVDSSQPVSAATSGQGGNSGTVIYNGGGGGYVSDGGSVANGGGAAGVYGATSGPTRGSGVTWTDTVKKLTATNGNANQDFGGGESRSYSNTGTRGRGLVVLEWGIEKLY
jgi:hypothetical protein